MTCESTLKAEHIFTPLRLPIAFLLTSVTPLVAVCQTFLSEEQATQLLFPGQVFSKKTLHLSEDEARCVAEKSEQKIRTRAVRAWASPAKDYVYIDEVIGINPEGKSWRKQFVDKTVESSLKFSDDIKSISGATLSSSHVTAGVSRILHTHECLQGRVRTVPSEN